MEERKDVGCLVIDDPRASGGLVGLQHLPGVRAYPFFWGGGGSALSALQALLHAARADCGAASILARGLGCGAALALAEQLPVERLALIDPEAALVPFRRMNAPRAVVRVNAFARRNLSLCVSDALVIESPGARGARRLCAGGFCAHARLTRLSHIGESDKELYTICENTLKSVITHFLRTGELPKNLAENAEMCIIDG